MQAPHWEHDETNVSCERKCLWNLNWHFKVEPELSMHLPTWWATWVAYFARIMFGNNTCWFKEILDGWYNSKCFHLGPWCATDHVTHQPGIKPEPGFLCINLLLTTISVPTCLFSRFVPSSCTCYCSIGKRNNLWDIGKKYWTWPFQVVYFPMIEIDFFWILYLTLQVMNSSTSSRLLTKVDQIFARVRSSGKPRNGLWFLTKLNKCYQPRWDDEQSWDRHSPNVNLIDHPSRGWHSVKHERGNLSGQSTSRQQNQGPRYFHDIHCFALS